MEKSDAGRADARRGVAVYALSIDAPAIDAPAIDAPAIDAPPIDAPSGNDVAPIADDAAPLAGDAPADAALLAIDAPSAIDAALPDVVVIPIQVITSHPHDPNAFTEGLAYDSGFLYESTGLYGSSTLRRVDPTTGDVVQSVSLADQYFGEGIALVGDTIIQLTYHEDTAFIYDRATFVSSATFAFTGEGWGLCYDGVNLYMSNGSSELLVRDPTTFAITAVLPVRVAGATISDLNELECVGDDILANVWLTKRIVRIQKSTGKVTAIYDASALPETTNMTDPNAVLNGIAYFPDDGSFYITGKLWPTMYEVYLPAP